MDFAHLQKHIYKKYIGNMGEEEGVYPHGGVLLSSEPVPLYMCIKLPKADNNDRAHKNDVNTLS